jgi:hypothetical protein
VKWCDRILICSDNRRCIGVAIPFFLNSEIRHFKLHTYEEALSLISIWKSVLAFAKRGFNFSFLFVVFLGKRHFFVYDVAYKLSKLNYSNIYFTYEFCDGDIQASFENYRRPFSSRWHGSRVFSRVFQRFIAQGNLQNVQLITEQGITSVEKNLIMFPTLGGKESFFLF